MSIKSSYFIAGLGGHLSEVSQRRDAIKQEARAKAAEAARARSEEAKIRGDLLKQEYKLKRENKRAEFEDKMSMFGDTDTFGANSIFEKLPEDIKKPFQKAHNLAMRTGDYEGAATITTKAATFIRSEEDQKLQKADRERTLQKENLQVKWKNEFDPLALTETDGKSNLLLDAPLTAYRANDPRIQKAESEYLNIMDQLQEKFTARDSEGNALGGIIDIDNPQQAGQAAASVVRAKNFFREVESGRYDPESSEFKAGLRAVSGALKNADEYFDGIGVDIVSKEYDNILSPEDAKLIRKYGGDALMDAVSDGAEADKSAPTSTSTEVTDTTSAEYKGKVYTVGEEVTLKDGRKVTLTPEHIAVLRNKK